MNKHKITFTTVLLVLAASTPQLAAQTLHHWRFEDGQFLDDTVGGATLVGTLAEQVSLPADGPGSDFSPGFVGGLVNESAAKFLDESNGLFNTSTTAVTGSFTIEVFTNIDDLSHPRTSGDAVFAAQASGNVVDPAGLSWVFRVEMEGGADRALALGLSDGVGWDLPTSRIRIEEQTDYYVAAAFDVENRLVTYYAKDLTNDTPLVSRRVGHSSPSVRPDSYFQIGNLMSLGPADGHLDGLIDEVRFSKGIVPFDDLLINSVPSVLDFNNDSNVDVLDIDSLVGEIVAGTHREPFDLTGEGIVDDGDLTKWLSEAATHNGFTEAYLHGDSNLDGAVNALDLNNLALNWRQIETPNWSAADFNADGVVDSTDLNELALNWRRLIPFAGTVPITAGSDAYVQTFDEALGPDGSVTGTQLPAGWTAADNGFVGNSTMRSFPINRNMPGGQTTTATYNAGADNDSDRALAVGVSVSGSEDDLALQLLAHTGLTDADSFRFQFDVEAWDAVDGFPIGNNVIAGPDDPGEAAFKLTVDIDTGDGFTSLADLGTVTTGSTLQPVFEGIVDGNLDANRIMFDSGIVSADIPENSKLRFRWAPDFDAQTNGWYLASTMFR